MRVSDLSQHLRDDEYFPNRYIRVSDLAQRLRDDDYFLNRAMRVADLAQHLERLLAPVEHVQYERDVEIASPAEEIGRQIRRHVRLEPVVVVVMVGMTLAVVLIVLMAVVVVVMAVVVGSPLRSQSRHERIGQLGDDDC